MVACVDFVGCRFELLSGDMNQGRYHGGINFSVILQKGSRDGLDSLCPRLVKVC